MSLSQWQSKLSAEGAQLVAATVESFGNPQQERISTQNSNVLCDLSHLGLIEITGADHLTFLQGQVTNDVNLLTGHNAHYTGSCTPKGRLLALFLAFAHRDHLHLQLPIALLAPMIKRLQMYVMRSKVTIKDSTDSIIQFGINGPDATRLMSAVFSSLPVEDYQLIDAEKVTILKLPSLQNQARYQILGNLDGAIQAWDALKASCQPVGKACWDMIEINAGIPEVVAATQEQFVPQMLNLDLLNGINFKKGCYTGQEIVARTHYLGTVKRRTYLADIQSEASPKAGDKVVDATQNEVGQIVRVAPNLNNGFDALIEMRIESAQSAFWQNHAIKTMALPYSLGDAGS